MPVQWPQKGLSVALFFLAIGGWTVLAAAEADLSYGQSGRSMDVSSSRFMESSTSSGASDEPATSAQCNIFTFDATASRLPQDRHVSFLWDFGDGETSREAVAEHTYEKAGDYTVTLSLTDEEGLVCGRAVHSRRVRVHIPPRAAIEAPERACVDEEIILDAASSSFSARGGSAFGGDNRSVRLSYRWDLGDGSQAYDRKKVAKIYTKGGSYRVSLTVDDNSGSVCGMATTKKIIRINEPPVAEAGEEVLPRCVHKKEDLAIAFDASLSRDVNNDALTYEWDFGDGQKGHGMQVTHLYAGTGHYEVKLVVSDGTPLGCGTGVDFVTVRLNKAPRAEAGEDITACVGDEVLFDGTQSDADHKGTLDGRWFFGDGQSSEGLKATHRYRAGGTYQAALVVENKLNAMCPSSRGVRRVMVNSAPAVVLRSADKVCVGDTVTLAASAIDEEGNSLKYYWNFGDGTMSEEGPQVTHAYAQGGRYRISVIVDDGAGNACSTGTAIKYIHVNTPPVADAGANLSCCAGIEADFTAAASADPDADTLTYTWDFGDGTNAEGIETRHAYAHPGAFDVLLTVDDQTETACSTSTAGFTAEVHDKPQAVINIR